MSKLNDVRSASALRGRESAHRGTLTDERCRELFHQAQDEKAQRVRASIYRLWEIAEEILAEGGE